MAEIKGSKRSARSLRSKFRADSVSAEVRRTHKGSTGTLKRQVGRLSRLAKKSTRKLGVVGAVIGAGETIGAASKIKEEGGFFISGFGKFVEQVTGMPRGSTGGGETDIERKARLTI